MAEPARKPIDPGIVQRVAQGLAWMVRGVASSDWFGPQQPMQPTAPPEVKGRAFDYPVGYNLRITPRQSEPVSFADLRALADGYDLLRLVIETRKDQLERLDWQIVDQDGSPIDALMTLFVRPDGIHSWRQWLRAVTEDMLVIDAATVYIRRTNGGGVFALEPIDGATIVPKIDQSGRRPDEGPAYQQVIKGVPAADYDADELVYFPRNVRTNRVYGYSPVEQVLTTVNIALRRQTAQLQYYTEGNLPAALIAVPANWGPDQIEQFDAKFNARLTGNTAERRRAYFVPDGTKPYQITENPLKDSFDDWLARIICFAFSISPQALIQQQNRATAQQADETAKEEGLEPLKVWVVEFVNACLAAAGYPEATFQWLEEIDHDPVRQAELAEKKVRAGQMTIDEWRALDGLEPLPNGIGAVPLIYTAAGVVRVEDVVKEPEPVPAALSPPPSDAGDDADQPRQDQGVGKSARFPFVIAKFLDTDEGSAAETVDASGGIAPAATDDRSGADDHDAEHKALLAAAILAWLLRWRKWILIAELRFAGDIPDDETLSLWSNDFAARTLDLVNQTTRARIERAIDDATSTSREIVDAVRDVFDDAVGTRSILIGETAATATSGKAALDAFTVAEVKSAEWVSERDDKVRPTHAAMDGQVRPVGTPFTSPSGAMALHPGGFGVPEEDVNCRCHLRAVRVSASKAEACDERSEFWKAREAGRTKGAKAIARVMRRIFRAQRKAMLPAQKLAKANPYHDARGRFSFAPETGSGSGRSTTDGPGDLADFLTSKRTGHVVVARLPDDLRAHFGAKTDGVWLSSQTRDSHGHHKWTAETFSRLQGVLDHGEVRSDRELNLIAAHHDGEWWYAAIKTTKDRSEVYLTTFHRLRDSGLSAFHVSGVLVRKGK